MQFFVALELQLQNRTSKPGAISSAICHRDVAGVSDMFETCCSFSATKIACVNEPLQRTAEKCTNEVRVITHVQNHCSAH